jgi:16S rRNA processing protein RimM
VGRPDWIEVGRVVRAHGVRGEVRVAPSTDNPDRFIAGSRVFLRPRGAAAGEDRRPLVVAGIRGDAAFPIVEFAGVVGRDEADRLRGGVLEIPAEELADLDEDEFYAFDLEGLEARTPAGTRLGLVKELLEAPANDVLVLTLESGEELLVPFIEQAVTEVKLEQGFLVVHEDFARPPE